MTLLSEPYNPIVNNVDAMLYSANSVDHGAARAPLWATLTNAESV